MENATKLGRDINTLRVCDMTHLSETWLTYEWHDSFVILHCMENAWLSQEYSASLWHDSFLCNMILSYEI